CRVCSRMSALTTSRVFGSSGPWPDTKSRLPARIAWASGEGVPLSVNPVVGAPGELMIRLGTGYSNAALISAGIGIALRRFGSSGCQSEEHTSELQSLRHLVCRLL